MTEPEYDDEFDPDDPDQQQPNPRNEGKDLRLLRKKAKDYDTVAQENALLKREIAFGKVNLPDTPMSQLFRDKYDGDLSPEAVQAAAVKYGLVEAPADPLADELAAHQRTNDAANGAAPTPGQITPDDVAQWPMDKMRRFQTKHPDEWETLKRGEPVSGITF